MEHINLISPHFILLLFCPYLYVSYIQEAKKL